MDKIVIKNLVKNFGSKEVLCGIDLTVKKGESLVILGGSGSGKSVLIKIIATLIQSTSGSIKIDGQEVSNIAEKSRDKLMEKFGFLFKYNKHPAATMGIINKVIIPTNGQCMRIFFIPFFEKN